MRKPHGLASNLANLLRSLTVPRGGQPSVDDEVARPVGEDRRKIVRHGRSIMFQIAEVMVPGALFQQKLASIAALFPHPPVRC